MRGLRVLVAISVATAGVLACEPITRDDLECPSGRCLDASAAPPDSSQPDASGPGADAAAVGADAGLDATVAPPDAAAPADASSAGDASCARLFNLGYPSGALLDSTCLKEISRFRAGPCSGAADCHLDSRAFYETPDDGLIESVTAGGRLWEYDGRTEAVLTNGADLSALAHLSAMGSGACALKPEFGCALDTRAYLPETSGAWIEVVTNNGTMWNYDAFSHAPVSTPAANGTNLIAQSRYSVGSGAPCLGLIYSQCRFQTQTYSRAGGETWEWVTFDGSLWIFDAATGTQQTGSNTKLSQVSRFAGSICAGVADCRLRTHAFVAAPDGGVIESFSD